VHRAEIEYIKSNLDLIEHEKVTPKTAKPPNKDVDKTKYHRPQEMVDLIYDFQTKDLDFKWFTHTPQPDMSFDIERYTKNAINKLEKNLNQANTNFALWNQLMFIAGNPKARWHPLSKISSDFNWANPDITQWCKKKPNEHPFKARLTIDNKTRTWSDCMKTFKRSMVFFPFSEKTQLSSRIKDRLSIFSSEMNMEFSEEFESIGSEVKIYCQCDQFLDAIRSIVEWCRENKHLSNELYFHMTESKTAIKLFILHKKAAFRKSFIQDTKEGLTGDFHKIREQLFSVADWSWNGPIKDTSYNLQLSCLAADTTQSVIFPKDGVGKRSTQLNECSPSYPTDNQSGIEHKLTIYKRTN
jgi:hypothetical protein